MTVAKAVMDADAKRKPTIVTREEAVRQFERRLVQLERMHRAGTHTFYVSFDRQGNITAVDFVPSKERIA